MDVTLEHAKQQLLLFAEAKCILCERRLKHRRTKIFERQGHMCDACCVLSNTLDQGMSAREFDSGKCRHIEDDYFMFCDYGYWKFCSFQLRLNDYRPRSEKLGEHNKVAKRLISVGAKVISSPEWERSGSGQPLAALASTLKVRKK
jgi:hypothetical protein